MVRPPSSYPRSFASWLPHTKSSMPGASVMNWRSRLIESPKHFLKSRKEFRRFLDISLSSLSELGYALRLPMKWACLTNLHHPAPAFPTGLDRPRTKRHRLASK